MARIRGLVTWLLMLAFPTSSPARPAVSVFPSQALLGDPAAPRSATQSGTRPRSPGSLPRLSPARALFLDFDGTLAELAPEPDAVRLPVGLMNLLSRLQLRLQGALALVSGRPLHDLDRFLAPLVLPAGAEHGACRRLVSGQVVSAQALDLRLATAAAQALVSQHAGLRLEVKTHSLALHYRQAPALEALCKATFGELLSCTPGACLQHGKCVVEIMPALVSKADAIAAFMREAPFAGRTPVFAGDDQTDECAFAWVQATGGAGLKVGQGASLASHRCASPASLRAWLAAAVLA